MPRMNVPILAFNRGLLSPKSMARVDLDRTRLSAEVFTNWLPKTQGAMSIRPGTQYVGSSINDTGAAWIEFVASTDDVALLELTDSNMRVWLGDDAHNLALLDRPYVSTTVSFLDTGWDDASTGGTYWMPPSELLPQFTAATTNGVTISASSENYSEGCPAWVAADRNYITHWADTGYGEASSLPTWFQVDFGSGNTESVHKYFVQASNLAGFLLHAPKAWTLQCNDVDTGTGWITVDSRSGQTAWGTAEQRWFTRPDSDTGTVEPYRYWRLNFTETCGSYPLIVAETQLFSDYTLSQVKQVSGRLVLNSTAIGSIAIAKKKVVVSPSYYGIEHALVIDVTRGPVTLRVGSSDGDDDYISETSIGTGYHNIAFTPDGDFHITFKSSAEVDRIIGGIAIASQGVVSIQTPWGYEDLGDVRYDNSADVIYADCSWVKPHKIERRGTGRSWSVVEYVPRSGPLLPTASTDAKLAITALRGNTTLTSDIPMFRSGHVGSLFRIFHDGQDGQWILGDLDAATDVVEVTGISDTGTTPPFDSERAITITVSGTWVGTISIEHSYDAKDYGFKKISSSLGTADHTANFSVTLIDKEDNYSVWYRVKFTAYTSGTAVVAINYGNGGVYGVARVTGYSSNTSVSCEVLNRFSDTTSSKVWQESYWSDDRGYPTAVALHSGRLVHAMGGSLFMSISDDYENFDDTQEGDAAPIIRTLGSGPVNNIYYLVSLLRLIIGTSGSEIMLRTSTDEVVKPTNCSAGTISTQGSANLRALRMDNKALFLQRSLQRLFMIGAGAGGSAYGDYENTELTLLVPDLLAAGVVSIAIQRQPDTRIHCVLADGKVAILTYEPAEEVVCWSMWETDGAVEEAAVLPGVSEDAVYYHVRRTINGATKRYLEKWALEAKCLGDTGLSWIADCAVSFTDTGRAATITGLSHLAGKSVIVWGDDTGQATAGKDLSPDVSGVQTTYAVDTGAGTITLTESVHHAVAGLPYHADWQSTKLSYAAEAGTALAQIKRVGQMAFVLYKTHNNAVFFGSDTGHLDPLPRIIDGEVVDADTIYETFDQVSMPFDGTHNPDSRIWLRAKAPRPCTVLALVPAVQTNERV